MALPALVLLPLMLPGATTLPDPGTPGAFSAGQDGKSERDRLRDLLALGDNASEKELRALAGMRTKKALDALHEIVLALHAPPKVLQGYQAFHEFRGDEELWPLAIDQLYKDALKHRRAVHRDSAARSLAQIGEPAFEAMDELLRKSREESVRSIVSRPIIEYLALLGDRKSLDLLFDNVQLTGPLRGRVLQALEAGIKTGKNPEELIEQLAKRLQDRKVGVGIKALLLEALAGAESDEAIEAIAACVEHPSPEVALRAIQLVGTSGQKRFVPQLEPLTKGTDSDVVVRAAIGALSLLEKDDPVFREQVLRWTRDGRLGARLGACLALAQLRDQESSDRLHDMLDDPAWQVRVEAIQQVINLRRKASIPILIERLGVERGRLVDDVALALRYLTALDLGRRPRRWSAWWEGEGEAFVVPPVEAVLEAEKKRSAGPAAMRSSVSFYGLQVTSSSVVFLIDISGSMQEPTADSRTRRPGEFLATRLDVARTELDAAVGELAEGVLFNIILFGTRVDSWKRSLLAMEERVRDQASKFIDGIDYGGGTNTYGGLIEAFEDERVDTIYLLSDGEPSVGEYVRPDDIRERVRLLNGVRKVQVHCISIGRKSEFMRALAGDTGGRYIEVGAPTD